MIKSGPVWALGMMSGTSLNGVDAAMVLTDGEVIIEFGQTGHRAYSEQERAILRAGLGRMDGAEDVAEVVETAHAELLSEFDDVDLIGFHGLTLVHDPRGRGTFQAGNGALLAEVAEMPVVWDFRSADVELGGEGAPLSPFFHFACAKWIDATRPIAFLDLGGVGALTWVDPRKSIAHAEGALMAFDTGPATAPIDDFVAQHLGQLCDTAGEIAARGEVSEGILAAYVEEAYFFKRPPKSLGRNDFATLEHAVAELPPADAVATLTAAAAAAVVKGAEHFPEPVSRILVSGGGRKNKVLMRMLKAGLATPVAPVEAVGLNGDMLDAQAMGYLAVRVTRGLPTTSPETTGVPAAIGGGVISKGPA